MSNDLKDFTRNLRDNRFRVILILLAIVVLVILGFILADLLLKIRMGVTAHAVLNQTPNVKSVPGGFDTPETVEYARLQQQQNQQKATQATKTGTSAIPTIINASKITDSTNNMNVNDFCQCAAGGSSASTLSGGVNNMSGVDFTTLNRLQDQQSNLGFNVNGDGSGASGGAISSGGLPTISGNNINTPNINGVAANSAATNQPLVATNQLVGNKSPYAGLVVRAVPGGAVLGMVGAGNYVRDPNGKIIGQLNDQGQLQDANGRIIGAVDKLLPTSVSSVAGGSASAAGGNVVPANVNIPSLYGQGGAATGPSSAQSATIQAAIDRQNAIVTSQKAQQVKQQLQSAMSNQVNKLFAAWANTDPVQYVESMAKAKGETGEGSGARGGSGAGAGAVMLKAGTIMFAVLDTAVNSDEPGPVMATIVGGSFKGAKLLGTLDRQDQKVILNFKSLNIPSQASSINVNAVAIDPDTARTALSSYTENHYLLRYGSLFAASFVQGYSNAVMSSGSTVTSNTLFGATQTQNPDLTPRQKIAVALGNVGTQYQSVMSANFNTPPTVYVNAGTGVGILFVSDVTMST